MKNKFSGNPVKKFILLAASVFLIAAVLAGCASGTAARGWSGVTELEDTLVFVTMTGRVYSVDIVTGAVLGEPIKMVLPASSGLSCIPSCGGQQTTPIAVYASPVTGEDMVIIGGYDGKVYAYPLIDGRLREQPRWIYPPQGNIGGSIIGGMVVADGKVYFGSVNGTVFALDVADGYKEWSYDIGQKIWSAPALAGNLLFIGCFDKKLYALDTVTGTKKWEFETGGAISSTPVVKDNLVYIGSYDRHIYAVDIEAGQQQWKFPYDEEDAHSPRNWFWAKPVISGNTLYAPCLDGKVYILNTDTGRYIDAINVSNAVGASPVLVGNSLVVAATNLAKNTSRVYAIDITNRGYRELTSFTEGVNAPLFTVNGVVYIHTTRDNFYGLNVQNGALQKFSLTTTTTTNK